MIAFRGWSREYRQDRPGTCCVNELDSVVFAHPQSSGTSYTKHALGKQPQSLLRCGRSLPARRICEEREQVRVGQTERNRRVPACVKIVKRVVATIGRRSHRGSFGRCKVAHHMLRDSVEKPIFITEESVDGRRLHTRLLGNPTSGDRGWSLLAQQDGGDLDDALTRF